MAKTIRKNTLVTIVGYVDHMDEDDPEAGIIISTEDDKAYRVDLNRQGRRLLNLIGEQVKAQGTVTQTEDGENRISITKLEVLEWEETYEDDSYDEPDDYFDRYDD
jgi:hypothetical protein